MKWVSLCRLDELTEGKGKYVEIDGFQLAVYIHETKPYVIDNYCPHAGGNLAAGHVDETGCAVCPLHDWPFRLATGELRDSPGVTVRTYPTRLLNRPDKPALVQAQLPIY